MRHLKSTFKIGRTSSHRRCLVANMLKSLIQEERIVTTVAKAKELRRHADRMITLAKKNDLSAKRRAIGDLMIRFNELSPKAMREVKSGNSRHYNGDRQVISKLFGTLGPRFANRNGGYTRIILSAARVGDQAQTCVLEYLSE